MIQCSRRSRARRAQLSIAGPGCSSPSRAQAAPLRSRIAAVPSSAAPGHAATRACCSNMQPRVCADQRQHIARRAMKMNRCDLDFDECAFRTVAIWTRNKKTATVQIVAGSAETRKPQLFMEFCGTLVVIRMRKNASQKNATHCARSICFQEILWY